MPIPVRFIPSPASLEGLLLCRGNRVRTLFTPVVFYVVLYTQEELCVLTCPGYTVPYWEARWKPLAKAVVYERSGEGKPTGPSKALYRTGRSCDTCHVQKMTRAIPLGPLGVLEHGASKL